MKKTTALIPTVLAAGLILAGCTSPTPPAPAPATTSGPVVAPATTPAGNPPASNATPGSGDAASDDTAHNAAAEAAVRTAEGEANGRVIELDREGNGWEVEVLVGDRIHEFRIDDAGTAVTDRRGDEGVHPEDQRRAAAATISVTDAMRAALAAIPGTIDDIELDDRNNVVVWEVTIDTADDDDMEVYVDATTGEVQA